MKPSLKDVTLIAIDTTPKAHLALRAIKKSLEQIDVGAVKLLTHNKTLKHAVLIPKIEGLEGYSRFCIRDLHKYVDTTHCLVIQADGFVLNGQAWSDRFLTYDYGGAPFYNSQTQMNGGFSLRSKRLLQACSLIPPGREHPEDAAICTMFRGELEHQGMRFMPADVANKFSFEGRIYNGQEWYGTANKWENQFGFHSLLSVLPTDRKVCEVYYSSGEAGDLIYGLPVVKEKGEGVIFMGGPNAYPYPLNTRWTRTGANPAMVDNLRPLIEAQPYVWKLQYTHGLPYSTTFDLNAFRKPWKQRGPDDFRSLFGLYQKVFMCKWKEDQPWLTVPDPIEIPGKPIVVARTERYQNQPDWAAFCEKHHKEMVFVGTEQEASVFQGFAVPHQIEWAKTANALELARIIAGAKVLVCNQSLPLAIAHGVGQKVLVECWPANSNCELVRSNTIYWKSPAQEFDFPDQWLL